MSLINDALKRARESQAQAPPPPPRNLEFKPVEPGQMVNHGPSLTLIAIACIALILAGLLAWQWLHKSASAPSPVVAKAAPPDQIAPPAPTLSVPPAPAPAAVPVPAKAPEPAAPAETKLVASAVTTPSEAPIAAAKPIQEVATVSASVTEIAPPKPAPPKLQAIVYRHTRPSAMISGKTLFVGDKYGDWRLVAISEESATLVGGGLTNVLILPQ
jgi:hypothetical protein